MTSALQPTAKPESMLAVTASREMQEVQAAIFLARQFPRDMAAVERKLMDACSRVSLAEGALYAYPRGKELVTGPSIRLAEAIAQAYGNLTYGIKELEQRPGESVVQAFAWDIENNVRHEKVFSVPHKRKTKQGTYALDDPRDIYELVANNGARRLRSCILGAIPGDLVEACVKRCEETLKRGSGRPLSERIAAMVEAFGKRGIGRDQLDKYLGRKIDTATENDVLKLSKIYKSIADGVSKPHEFFAVQAPTGGSAADLNGE